MTDDIGNDLAAYIVETRHDAVSQEAIEAAKKSILDLLGVTLAASGLDPAMRRIVDLIRECGGPPESSVIGFGGRAPAIWAAFANGAMAHCLDYDDLTP